MSSRRIEVATWVPAAEWARTDPWRRRQWLDYVAGLIRDAKVKQIQSGVGADGRPLRRVLPTSRPDHTRDRPLIPHDDASRAIRLLSTHVSEKNGTVTLAWNYFTDIILYHSAGAGHLPVRDVVGTPGRFLRPVRAKALARWKQLVPERVIAGGPPPVARRRLPLAARPRPQQRPGFFL